MHLLRQTWSIQSGNKLPASLMVHINNCLVTPPVTASISPARLPTLSIRDAMHIRLTLVDRDKEGGSSTSKPT